MTQLYVELVSCTQGGAASLNEVVCWFINRELQREIPFSLYSEVEECTNYTGTGLEDQLTIQYEYIQKVVTFTSKIHGLL